MKLKVQSLNTTTQIYHIEYKVYLQCKYTKTDKE